MDKYHLEDLREDAQLLRRYLLSELDICEQMIRAGRQVETWRERKARGEKLLAAHRRVANYIASTGPQNRLPARPAQGVLDGIR